MDINSLDFSYSVLAAAAFCHFSTFDVVHKVSGRFGFLTRAAVDWLIVLRVPHPPLPLCPSGLTWESVAPCVRWMSPFMDTLRSELQPQIKNFPKVKADDRHNIQTHVTYLDLLVSKTNAAYAHVVDSI